jgi:glycosyltransferase involved in cell wall biosynthesis
MRSPSIPRRVLMTADTVGGVWTYALELARALGVEGVEVALATFGRLPTTDQRHEARTIPTVDLFESSFRLPWMEDPWDDLESAGYWLAEVTERVSPDLVHLNDPVYAALHWDIPAVAVGHSCVLSWWQSVWKAPAPASWDRYHREMARGLAAASAVVAPSTSMLNALRRHYGITGGTVIRNGRDASLFVAAPKEAFVFAAGRLWDVAKNLLALDEAAEQLPWPVYVAGELAAPGQAEEARARHLALLGSLSTQGVATWLARAGIYAFPARYEPFGLSVLEAALAECALVLGDIPSLRELWDGVAVFVDPTEPATLRRAIEALIDDTQLRQTLAMRARRRALTLTPRRMALEYLQLYSDLLSHRDRYAEEPACAL